MRIPVRNGAELETTGSLSRGYASAGQTQGFG
jgi:hypothetical protein